MKGGITHCYSHFDQSAKTINVERWHVQKGLLIFKSVSLLIIIFQSECVFEVKWLWSYVLPYIWTMQTCKYISIPFSNYEMSKTFRIERPDNCCELVLVFARMQTFLAHLIHSEGTMVASREDKDVQICQLFPLASPIVVVWLVMSWTTCWMRNQLGFTCLMDHWASK